MATRSSSRRSAGGSDVLNKAMINLLPAPRLKEELLKRSLCTEGNRQALADRLTDFFDVGPPVPPQTAAENPSPGTSMTQSTPAKRKSNDKSIPKESSAKKRKRKSSQKEDTIEPQEVNETPVDDDEIIEEEFIITKIGEPKEEPSFDSDDDQPLVAIKPAKKKKRRRNDDVAVETGEILSKGDSDWVPPAETEFPRKKRHRRQSEHTSLNIKDHEEILPKEEKAEMKFDCDIYDTGHGQDNDVLPEVEVKVKQKKIVDVESVTSKKSRDLNEGSRRGSGSIEKRKDSSDSREMKQRAPPISKLWAEMMEKKKNEEKKIKEDVKKEDDDKRESPSCGEASPSTPISVGGDDKKKKEGERRSVSFAVPRAAPRNTTLTAQVLVPHKTDLLGGIMERQQLLLEKKVKTAAEKEDEKLRVEAEMKQRAFETKVREEKAREERIWMEKEKEKREKEEKEKAEKERLSAARKIKLPVPPPPPRPKPKKSPSDDLNCSDSPQSEGPRPPPYEPIDNIGGAPQYEPLEDYTGPPLFEPLEDVLPGPSSDTIEMEKEEDGRKWKREERKKMYPPSSDEFIADLSSKLQRVFEQREKEDRVREEEVTACLTELVGRVERKVEKELKWERAAKRRASTHSSDKKMLADPRALLAKASNILLNMNGNVSLPPPDAIPTESSALQITQEIADPGYTEEEVDRPLPEFHGEPVPSDDDEALFLEAAGLPKKERKPKHTVVEEEAPPSHEHVQLDYYNACLHVKSASDCVWVIEPENADGLALVWGGVRTNHAIRLPLHTERQGTKIVFQIKLIENQSIRHLPFTEADPFDVRIGYSLRNSPNILGEYPQGWCYSTTGKKATNNVFTDWGDPAEIGDVITALFDVDCGTLTLYKNEECMGTAFTGIILPDGEALFPHICLKNIKVAVNLGDSPNVEGGWGDLKIDNDWVFPTMFERREMEMSKLPLGEKANCTLLMMVGLPGVGKTTWVRQYIRDHQEETWNVINSETVMGAMKVHGVARPRVHNGRWDMVLGLIAKALSRQVLLAARRRRNYMVDLSNVNKESRKRRLMHFKDFTKRCVVIIPDEEEMNARQLKQSRQDGANIIPPEAMLEMKAVFSIPTEEGDDVDEVHFIEPPIGRIAEAIDIVNRFNEEGRPWYQKRYRGRNSRRGGRGGYPGTFDRRGSDFGRPLSISTSGLNGSGPSSFGERRSIDSPATRGPGAVSSPLTPSSSGLNWASRKFSS